jgi:hypothetical protein
MGERGGDRELARVGRSQQRVGAIGELLESFEPRVFEARRELGDVA